MSVNSRTILLVDDEQEILNMVRIFLQTEGYRVLEATTGAVALDILAANTVDVVVLDVMMPGMDGIATCIRIREKWNVPILMLSAKSEDIDKIVGLSTGADDYMVKPFNPLELVARVKSQLRRYTQLNTGNMSDSAIEVDGLAIYPLTHEVTVDGNPVKLTPREFDILELLARNPGLVFSSEDLYTRLWNEPFLDSSNTVMVHIRKIREKIEPDPRTPTYIKTVWGVGYKIDHHSAR